MVMGGRALLPAALLALLLAGPQALPRAAAQQADDEAWIDAWMQRDAEQREVRQLAESLPFAELGALVGEPVRVWLADGRVRRGIVERADGRRATLRTPAPTGYFSFTVDRAEVRRLERVAGP